MGLNVELLAESFDAIVPQKDVFAARFYRNLFVVYHQTQAFFQDVDMKRQEASLIAALSVVISSLKKSDVQQLAMILQKLGHRHEVYGVQHQHYWMVGNVLLRTLAEFLGDRWTAELNDAWANGYIAIVGLMTAPMNEVIAA